MGNRTKQERDLFEFLQEDLERNTEFLHEMTEQPIEAMDREEMINYTRVTRSFGQKMLEGIKKGLTSDKIRVRGGTQI
jgi:ariadne-1